MSNSPPSDLAIEGQFYSGDNSHRQDALLRSVGGELILVTASLKQHLSLQDLNISPRVGNTPRYLYLPDDGVFETTDNDRVDQLGRGKSSGRMARLLHRLENHLGLILTAVVATIAVTAFAFVYGVPWTAKAVAHALPDRIAEQVGESTLTSLDGTWLEPSELSEARQQALQRHFEPFLAPVGGQELKVLFRSAPAIGANALALPDGTLIFTDELVELAETNDELVAILAHEIGHVEHRHGMQGMVQSSLTFWLIVMMTGDLSAFSDTTVMVPAVLMSLSYSRTMERQADQYALETLQRHDLDPRHFANIMSRLAALEDTGQGEGDEEREANSRWSRLGDLLSSHPVTEERIQRFRDAASR
ncbi:M48 family metallopeptidase [Marinobacter sp. M216]|uniref:M48 family metallopeptidase n=1 Tax=Marinobacter albus TaxID=3030833 RepID=A0ABT7H8Q5_9GAMM|nr:MULTISPECIES: M48 family metallopeptidase [unclassified Marinobacter]MDK9556437.1 M48 family metallopeptidase [Marinobacter sp. M216]